MLLLSHAVAKLLRPKLPRVLLLKKPLPRQLQKRKQLRRKKKLPQRKQLPQRKRLPQRVAKRQLSNQFPHAERRLRRIRLSLFFIVSGRLTPE